MYDHIKRKIIYIFEANNKANNIKNKEFKPHEHNYTIYYDILDKNFFTEYSEISYFTNNLWYFKSYQDCQKIINNCENDLKIIFDV